MTDTLVPAARSALMARVKARGNKSTEIAVMRTLRQAGIKAWTRHPKEIPGTPDFWFPQQRLALFVDGCFWHACPRCGRIPKSRRAFWLAKIQTTASRDRRIRRVLRARGISTMRVWEHEVAAGRWVVRLRRRLVVTCQ